MEISREVTINCCHKISSFGESVSLGMRAMSYSVQFGLLFVADFAASHRILFC